MYAMNGKRSKVMRTLAAVAAVGCVSGCEPGGTLAGVRDSGPPSMVDRIEASSESLPGWIRAAQPIIRYRNDTARSRSWILTSDGVDLYDSLQRRKVAHLEIPGWFWVHEPFACAPEIALGPRGELVITSNVMPTLWRIDPQTLAMSRHPIAFEPGTGKDFGFTALTYSKTRGAYFGVAAFDGSVWRIDPQLRSARIASPEESGFRACLPA